MQQKPTWLAQFVKNVFRNMKPKLFAQDPADVNNDHVKIELAYLKKRRDSYNSYPIY